jgi:DNA-binding response OmpR family regulator
VSARKILLVDDAGTLLLLEQAILHSAGFQIVAAKDGEAGVRAALDHRPSLILLATDLPGPPGTPGMSAMSAMSAISAAEVCHRLRAHEATRAIPILLLAPRGARTPEKNVDGGFPSGCEGCIIKPFDHNELLSKVRSLLGD